MSSPVVTQRQPNRSLPMFLRAGDALTWTLETDLSVGFSVFYVLTAIVNNVAARINVGGTGVAVAADGSAAFNISSATTAAWQPGKYQWVLFSVDGNGNRHELAQDSIRIDPDPNGATPADPRTKNMRLLANVRCLLEGKAIEDAIMYKIGDRELTKMPLKDLLYWEAILEARVRRERIRRGEFVPSNTIGITFGGRGV